MRFERYVLIVASVEKELLYCKSLYGLVGKFRDNNNKRWIK